MTAAIDVVRLTKRFRRLHGYRDLIAYAWRSPELVAVDDISLRIEQGELFGVLGQNGAGKTTLIRMLSTMLLPTAGQALVEGHDVVREPHKVRRRIGLITGEERSFYLRLTGRENLEFFAALFRVPSATARERMNAMAERLDLSGQLDRPYNQYSSGMRQKLAIIRGLLTEPRVLFMDEPTRALDPISAHVLRRFVLDHVMGELGCTVLLATHSTVEAEELCDRLALIRDGRVAAIGTIGELRAAVSPQNRAEIRVRELPAGLLDELRANPLVQSVSVEPNGTTQRILLGLGAEADALDAVLAQTLARGAHVIACSMQHASLEEIYLATHGATLGGSG
jgi:ABC-2 type transport system ATP-binding protein